MGRLTEASDLRELREREAERLYEAAYLCGLVNDLRHWNGRSGKDGEWDWSTPALDEPTKDKWRKLSDALRVEATRHEEVALLPVKRSKR